MDGGAEPRQRGEMLGHAVAHVTLEAVARMRQRRAAPSAGRASPWRRSRRPRSRRRWRRRCTTASQSQPTVDAVAAVDEDEPRTRPAAPRPRAPAPTARRAGYCRGRCARAARRRPRPRRWRRSWHRAFRASAGSSFLESSRPRGTRLGSRMTAAATTGPASGPRPASSQPATGQTPRFEAARSRRKVGRMILLAERQARGAGIAAAVAASRLMARWCAREPASQSRRSDRDSGGGKSGKPAQSGNSSAHRGDNQSPAHARSPRHARPDRRNSRE